MSEQRRKPRGSLLVAAVSYILALLFLSGGLAKLWGAQMVAEQFAAWNYPPSFMYMVGVVEVIAALLLLAASARFIGAFLLLLVMFGAMATHFFSQEWVAITVPAVILLTLAWIMARSPLPTSNEELERGDPHRQPSSAH